MDRRTFLLKLCGAGVVAAGAATIAPLLLTEAKATPLDALKNLEVPDTGDSIGAAPDGTPTDEAYWVWRNGRRIWVQPRRRRVCRNVWVNGRRVRRCWWR